jgi:FkbM family methyltransferase
MQMRRKYSYYLTSAGELLFGFRNWFEVVRIFLGVAGAGPHTVVLRSTGLSFLTRGKMDIWTIKETFLDRFYEIYGFPIGRGWVIMDIGGGVGDFSILSARADPQNHVVVFEPTPESLHLLKLNLQANGISNADTYGEAVWSGNGGVELQMNAGDAVQFSSRSASGPGGATAVPSLRLSDALERVPGRRCDLLKVDCEGAEYPIFYSTGAEVFSRIERIVMETHEGVMPNDNAAALASYLRQQGYAVETFANPVHAHLGYLRAWRG